MKNDNTFANNENINPNIINPSHGDTQTISISNRDGAQRRRYDTYHLHVDIQPTTEEMQQDIFLSHEQKEQRRNNGDRHLDLWTDGSMYPKDPFTNTPPPFSNITNLLHFIGDGRRGLLWVMLNTWKQKQWLQNSREIFY